MKMQRKKLLQCGFAVGTIVLLFLWSFLISPRLNEYGLFNYAGSFFISPLLYSLFILFGKNDLKSLFIASAAACLGYLLNSRDTDYLFYKQSIIYFLVGSLFIYFISLLFEKIGESSEQSSDIK